MGIKLRLAVLAASISVVAAAWSGVSAQATPSPQTTALHGTSGVSGATTTTSPSSTVVVKNGGTVRVAIPYLPSEFNPSTPSGQNAVTAMVMSQVWPSAFVVNGALQAVVGQDSHGAPGLFSSAGAELVGVNPETVIYSINPLAKWSDGVPISVEDFVYNWQEQLRVGGSLTTNDPLAGYQDIASITGSHHGKVVKVVFAKPFADWEALFANLVPAHIGSRYGWVGAFGRFNPARLVSGGPFIITRVVPHKEIVLSRNKNYWGNAPALDHIIFRVEPSQSLMLAALKANKVDIAQLIPSPAVNQTIASSTDLVAQQGLTPTLLQLDFNLATPMLSSVNARLAIAEAIDRSQLISNTIGFVTPFSQVAKNRLYGSGAPGSQGNDGGFTQVQLAQAQALFAAAGDRLGPSGQLVTPSGTPVTLNLIGIADAPMTGDVEAELQSQLLQIGIALRIHNVSAAALLGRLLPRGAFDLALVPYAVSTFPSAMAPLYTSPVGPIPSNATFVPVTTPATLPPTNAGAYILGDRVEPDAVESGAVTRDVMGYEDPVVTTLFQQASSELNTASEAQLFNAIDADLWRDLPTLPLFQLPVVLVTRDSLVNVNETQTLVGPLWDAQDWAIQISPPPTTTTTTP